MLCPTTPSQAIYSGAMWGFEMSIASIYRTDPVIKSPRRWEFTGDLTYNLTMQYRIAGEFGSLAD